MKMAGRSLAVLFALSASFALAAEVSPIGKVVQLLTDLEAKIKAEGAETKRVFNELSASCHKDAQNLGFDITTSKSEIATLQASIEQKTGQAEELGSKIGDLTGQVATCEADLSAAQSIRDKERDDFNAQKSELNDIINTLQRAIAIISREMAKGGASMLQLKSATSLVQALNVLVEASMFGSADASRLTALLQSSQGSDEDDSGAPAASVYKSHSSGIVDTLENLLDKANAQLEDAQKKEIQNQHNFDMLRQSLEDEITFGNKDLAATRKSLSETTEAKSSGSGELRITSKDLAGDEASLTDLNRRCMTAAQDHEAASKDRAAELAAIAKAKEVIASETSGAEQISYGLTQTAFFQVASTMDLANFEAVRFVRDLARKNSSPALSQLASRMAAAMHGGDDQFVKVKGLIQDLLDRLENEAGADATEKAYCDKELAETNTKNTDKNAEIAKLSTKIDQMSARSAKLKEQVADLQKSLANLAESQAAAGALRSEEKTLFGSNRAEMEKGLAGIKLALRVLREYYASDANSHGAAEGAGQSIIGLLEVVESDFTKDLAEMVAAEESAVAAYEQETQDAQIARTNKEQDVKYKNKESTDLDKAIAEASSDRSGVQAELDAVLEYLSSLTKRCVAKAETYGERSSRRAAEVAGLKEALTILDSETALLQRRAHHALRGHNA